MLLPYVSIIESYSDSICNHLATVHVFTLFVYQMLLICIDEKDICEMWQAHYKNLLKSFDSSKSKESVERELHSIKDSAIVFGPVHIFNAHKSTKTGKVCGVDGFAAERFIHASPIIYMYICL